MKRIFILLFFLAVNSIYAQGVAVQGHLDCGRWLEARKNSNSKHFEHYLLGFVNGLALGRMVDIWNAKGTTISNEQLYYWMDNYCNKNPLNSAITGSFDFANEMTNGEYNKKSTLK